MLWGWLILYLHENLFIHQISYLLIAYDMAICYLDGNNISTLLAYFLWGRSSSVNCYWVHGLNKANSGNICFSFCFFLVLRSNPWSCVLVQKLYHRATSPVCVLLKKTVVFSLCQLFNCKINDSELCVRNIAYLLDCWKTGKWCQCLCSTWVLILKICFGLFYRLMGKHYGLFV